MIRISTRHQIIAARVKPKDTLAATLSATLAKVERLAKDYAAKAEAGWGSHYDKLGPNDTLLLPEMDFQVLHHYAEIEHSTLANTSRAGQPVELAAQMISFRLDKGGASLRSEAKVLVSPVPTHFEFTKPFLLVLRMRGVEQPFFVAWIENAELLQAW
ncbi:MAG: hypothetical protein AB1705_23720 [Verrucomicrobiota bacterium]